MIDKDRVRRALRTYQTNVQTYAELSLLTELLVAHLIAGEADFTEVGVSGIPNGSSLLTAAQAAAVAGVTQWAIWRAIRENRLAVTKTRPYLIAPTDLATYMRKAA